MEKALHVTCRASVVFFLVLVATSANSQNTCGAAVGQLQQYVQRVNMAYGMEYNNNIPMRCGRNPNCMQAGLMQLNNWYAQQAQMVNNWYAQITQQCNQNQASGNRGRPSRGRPRTDEPGEMDVDDIEVDDQDKSVRIRIPSNPRGYR